MEHSVYFYSAIAGCTLVGLQVIMQVFGLFDDVDLADGVDADVDVGADHDGHSSSAFFGILTFKAVCAFTGIFGLVGLMMLRGEAAFHVRVLAAGAAGVAAMFGVAWMMKTLSRLQASGTVELRNAVGGIGTVYLRIPDSNSGVGKVTIEIQGRSMEFSAATDGAEIATGARVTVVAVEGDETLKVEPVKEVRKT